VKLVTRASYSHHYRRIIPALLDVLSFQCNNDLHRPVMDALALLYKYRDDKAPVFPETEKVPLDGVVRDHWQDLVRDDKHGGGINRITYEWCVLTALREQVRCKEVWVKGADRFRNPDEDLPEDFDARREEYYAAIEQPRDARVFVETLRRNLDTALAALDSDLPSNSKVSIVTTKRGKGRISVTPLDEQPEPPNIIKLTAALVGHWPMTNLLDILKETESRVRFTDVFRTVGSREVLAEDVLQRRLLLCLHGLGTNAGLKRMWRRGQPRRLAVHSAALHHQRAHAGSDRQGMQRDLPRPQPGYLGRSHDSVRVRLEEVWSVGPEPDDGVARALRRSGSDDLLARGEAFCMHLLTAQDLLVV
jgi:hypothetical protein